MDSSEQKRTTWGRYIAENSGYFPGYQIALDLAP